MTAPLPPLLLRGDCLTVLRRIPDESVDAVVTDPPYGLEFMGKAWDKYTPLDFELWCAKWAAECLRILKPAYVAKAPKSERPVVDGTAHPTVKPLALMRWLIRLVTPPGGVVVDPFAGSGTTLEAAYLEGFESIGVEMTPDYWPLVAARIERVTK